MEELFKEKVFITGINGFTGVHLEKYLLDIGFEVFGTTLRNSDNPNHFLCDILKEEILFNVLNNIKPKYIIHLAAISFVATKNKQSIYDVNVFGSLNLLEAISKLNYVPSKILIASSAAVYGNVEGELDETMCLEPVNHYGNSKLVMENMVKSYFEKQNIVIARPFNYTGIGQSNNFLVPKIVSHFKSKSDVIELGNIDVYREFNDVDYVINCYYNLLISDCKSEIVNVCSGNTSNIKEILLSLERISNHKIIVKVNPKFIRNNEIKILKGSDKKLKNLIDLEINNNLIDVLKKMYFE